MAEDAGAGVIQHHAGHMEHPAHHVDGVFRTVKVFVQFPGNTARILHFHIIPCINVDFFNTLSINVFG